MQQASPALSSPSTGFLGHRASPLFIATPDQGDPFCSSSAPPDHHHHHHHYLRPLPPSDYSASSDHEQAPPKQLAQAMDVLGQAMRHLAEVRVGADLLLEALGHANQQRSGKVLGGLDGSGKKPSEWVLEAAEKTRQSLEALRTTGRKLECSGVLNGAQQKFEEKQPWGLQTPLICPDGAIVAYSWKRQIAGQAAASAVDRTRLALKAFAEQKVHFFPCLNNTSDAGFSDIPPLKKPRVSMSGGTCSVEHNGQTDETSALSLSALLQRLQTDVPGLIVSPFTWLNWTARAWKPRRLNACAVSIPKFIKQETGMSSVADGKGSSNSIGKIAILEVTLVAVFKAVIRLSPAGSTCPDGIVIYSIDEVGNHVINGGASNHYVFQHLSELGTKILHTFLQINQQSSLLLLLKWLYTYQSLFTKACSECKRVLVLDRPSDLLLPPIVRPLNLVMKGEELNEDKISAYHLGCVPADRNVIS